jgi:hypothetical protein
MGCCCHCRCRTTRVVVIRPSDYKVVARVQLDDGQAVVERYTSRLTGRVSYRYRLPWQRYGQPAHVRQIGEPKFTAKTPFPSRHVFFNVGLPDTEDAAYALEA